MHINHTKLIHGALFLASALLTACGGGGGAAAPAPAATYSIGGTVSGLTGTVVLQNNGGNDLSITGNGSFTFTTKIAGGAAYNVTVLTQPAGQTCTASGNTGTVSGANVTNVSVTCSANTYTIGGSITGLAGTVILQNNGGDNLTISTAGASNFTFTTPVARGAAYAVSVLTQPANQRCTATSGSGTNVQANITSVAVTCVPAYTISANVSGYTPSIGLVLQNKLQSNGNENLSIGLDGTYPFSKTLITGETYNVKVLIQPAAPAKTCTITGGTGTMASSGVNVTITCAPPIPQFAYVANTNSNNVSAYSITGGVLFSIGTPVSTGIDTNPNSVTVDPSGKFAYVANILSSDISAFTINTSPPVGGLTQINCGGSATCNNAPPANGTNFLAGTNPISVTVDPTGQFAYVANVNSHDISAYTINTVNGALTQINCTGDATVCNGKNFLAGLNPSSVTVDHTGKFAYVANANEASVSAYTIDAATGALSAVAGSPFAAGAGPQSLDIDPTSRFAYVANANSGNISAYAIDANTGALTSVPGSPFSAGITPTSIAVDPSGSYVYVANKNSNNISAFSIDNAPGGTGALTEFASSPILAGTQPTSITVALSGEYVYVANSGGGVSAYLITSGALSTIAGSPFGTGSGPASVISTVVY